MPMKAPDPRVEHRADGSIIITSNHPLGPTARSIAHLFAQRAAEHPDRPFIHERIAGRWQGPSYAEAKRAADGVAQWLIDRGITSGDGILILSANSVEQAELMLGAYMAGTPVVPLSTGFSLLSNDFAKLRHAARLIAPRLVFAQSSTQFAAALAALRADDPSLPVVTADGENGTIAFVDMAATRPTAAVAAALDAVGGGTVAKHLFTSGSTGLPKAVPQTHGMMTAAIAAEHALMELDDTRGPPTTLEWMPWSHVSAGNVSFNRNLWNGGTLHIDDGRPTAAGFAATIRNLHEVSPTMFASVPVAFAMLTEAMEGDAALRRAFFARMRYLSYGGAALTSDVYDRIQALAVAETGRRIPFTTMYGATETQPVTTVHWHTDTTGLIGLPLPGVTVKLVPNGAKLEVRVKGPSVASGYHRDPNRTAEAFDDEGFYRLGDACRFVDPDRLDAGLVFDGRVTEDFKLDSGTWVSVGTLRADVVAACSPHVADVVIAGHDRPCVTALIVPTAAARALPGVELGDTLARRLAAFNASAGGGSRRITRFAILDRPPEADRGEVSDKGTINQRAMLDHHAATVARLYENPVADGIVAVA